jgi:hypothetical protein
MRIPEDFELMEMPTTCGCGRVVEHSDMRGCWGCNVLVCRTCAEEFDEDGYCESCAQDRNENT